MDPFGIVDTTCRYYYTRIIKELKKNHIYGKDGITWPNLELKILNNYPCQTDGFNCGFFILYYAECLMSRNDVYLNQAFDPMLHRVHLKELLLKNSNFMRDIC